MKILFVNQFYWPDVAATAQQMSDLAEHLAVRGHEVGIVCSRGQYDDGSGRPTEKRQTHRGVTIRRLSAPGFGKTSTLGRVIDYFGFHLLAGLWVTLFGWRYDVIVTLTTPPLIGLYGTLVRWMTFGRTKHVCWSMDLHPDCEFELGICSRRNPLWWTLDNLNALHFRQANAVVALGECMEHRLLAKGVSPSRMHVIGVWNRVDEVEPMAQGASPLRGEHGLDGRFVVMYSGNAGLIHTFDAVCEAMRRLKDDDRIRFVFVGGGKRLSEIAAFAEREGLKNFVRLPYVPRERLSESLAMGDVHLVTMRSGMAGVAVPCKLYGIMAASRPALFVGPPEADTARQIVAAECGVVLNVNDADGLVEALRRLAADSQTCRSLGEAGRRYFLAHHEREVCCEKWERLLEQVARA